MPDRVYSTTEEKAGKKRAKDRRYKEKHRKELAARQKAYYEAHKEECDAKNRARQELCTAAKPFWYRALVFANASNRRAREFGITEKLYGRQVKMISGPCVYCGKEQDGWDHVIPLSLGGANHFSNLAPCCLPCNKKKADRIAVRNDSGGWNFVRRPQRPDDLQWIAEILQRGNS